MGSSNAQGFAAHGRLKQARQTAAAAEVEADMYMMVPGFVNSTGANKKVKKAANKSKPKKLRAEASHGSLNSGK